MEYSMELTLEEALKKAVEAHKAGDIQEADRLYTAILKAQPKHPDANHNMGVLAVGVDKIEAALLFFKTALEANSSISQFWLSYINALMKLDRIADAQAAFYQAKDKGVNGEGFDQLKKRLFDTNVNQVQLQDPTSEQLQPIINLYTQGNLLQALSDVKEMLKKFPNSAALYNIAGASSAGLMQYDAAIDSYKQATQINPHYAEVYNNMGTALKSKGDLEGAIDSYKQATKINPSYADAYNNMGIALNDKGDLDAAIESYKQTIQINPSYADAYNNMGFALHDKGDLKAALDSYKQAIQINPDYAGAYNNMGTTLKDMGDLEAAIDSYKQAIQIDPDYSDVYNNMGNLFQENRQYTQAKECFDQFTGTDGSVAKALECSYHLEKHSEFNEVLVSIAKKNPANIRVAAMSAFAAHQTKQRDVYPFCKNPIELIQFSHIKDHVPDSNKFINAILDEMKNQNALWEPKNRTTKSGFQTSGNLFTKPSENIKLLENIIQKELCSFHSKYKIHKSTLIENWPKKHNLVGWYVHMLQNGHQGSHIHPSGWVSGVFYLKTVETPAQNEGAIEFGMHGYDYPVKNEDYPRRIYQPCNGDLILFPSSLFHKTIPVIKDVERCVIAFDLVR